MALWQRNECGHVIQQGELAWLYARKEMLLLHHINIGMLKTAWLENIEEDVGVVFTFHTMTAVTSGCDLMSKYGQGVLDIRRTLWGRGFKNMAAGMREELNWVCPLNSRLFMEVRV